MSAELLASATLARPRLSAEELRRLHARHNGPGLAQVVFTAAGIVGTLFAYAALDTAWAWLPCVLLVGAFQHRLLILQHEAIHFTLFTNRRWNELTGHLTSWLIAFTLRYRSVHLAHHRRLGQPSDPDLPNYASYPAPLGALILDGLKNLSGVAAAAQFWSQVVGRHRAHRRAAGFDPGYLGVAAAQFTLFIAFAAAGAPERYFTLWLLPLVTVAKSLAHFRNVAEHTALRDCGNPEPSRMRTLRCGWIERFFFAPLHFNYHADHHFFPGVPHFRLPDLHAHLRRQPSYLALTDLRDGYLRFLLDQAREPAASPQQRSAGPAVPSAQSVYSEAQKLDGFSPGTEHHFWNRAKARIVWRRLRRLAPRGRVLDLGAGPGITVQFLRAHGVDCFGCDLADYEPRDPALRGHLLCHDGFDLPAAERERIGAILLLDLLEHLATPDELLDRCRDRFPKLQWIMLTVPARQELWSNYDMHYGHHRRYDRAGLAALCDRPGLELVAIRYYFHCLYPLLRVANWLAIPRAEVVRAPRSRAARAVHDLLSRLISWEEHLIPGRWLGSSLVAEIRVHHDDPPVPASARAEDHTTMDRAPSDAAYLARGETGADRA